MGTDALFDQAALDRLGAFSSPTIANAIEKLQVRRRDAGYTDGSIRCMFPALAPMVGYAVTARIRSSVVPGDAGLFDLLEAVAAEIRPSIVVIEDLDDPAGRGSYWGEVNANMNRALGCLGVVTNGSVRDLPEMEAIGFQTLAGSVCVSHGYIRTVDIGMPVTVGGLTVTPGDLLHADLHGAVHVPIELVDRLPDLAADLERMEQVVVELCHSPECTVEMLREALVGPGASGSEY